MSVKVRVVVESGEGEAVLRLVHEPTGGDMETQEVTVGPKDVAVETEFTLEVDDMVSVLLVELMEKE
jgi:hypothetical protein